MIFMFIIMETNTVSFHNDTQTLVVTLYVGLLYT